MRFTTPLSLVDSISYMKKSQVSSNAPSLGLNVRHARRSQRCPGVHPSYVTPHPHPNKNTCQGQNLQTHGTLLSTHECHNSGHTWPPSDGQLYTTKTPGARRRSQGFPAASVPVSAPRRKGSPPEATSTSPELDRSKSNFPIRFNSRVIPNHPEPLTV